MKKYFDIKETPFGYDEAATYRALCLFSGIMHLIFHYIYIFTIKEAIDPFWQRMLVGFVPLIVLWLESNIAWVKKHFILLCMIMIHANNFWFIYLMYINQFMPEYYTGYFIVVMAIGFTFSRLSQLFWFVVSTTFYLIAAFLLSTEIHISPIPAFSIIAAIFLLAWILLHLKITFNNRLNEKNLQLEIKNKEITDSINYAKRIQDAILPSANQLNKYLKDGFVLYVPKDIVAGDFYWMEHVNGITYFAAADCTGHGVPGAMVSVICCNALNKSLIEENITEPAKILDRTRDLIIERFSRSEEDMKDGMDISLCSIDWKKMELSWAGANNPVWIINPNRLGWPENVILFPDNKSGAEIKANKQPIGNYVNASGFTNHSIKLEPGDTIYIFTDGFQDQFGGEMGKKFKASNLKNLLSSIYLKNMDEQKNIISETFEDWKGNLEQIDDVCVIGVRV